MYALTGTSCQVALSKAAINMPELMSIDNLAIDFQKNYSYTSFNKLVNERAGLIIPVPPRRSKVLCFTILERLLSVECEQMKKSMRKPKK